MRYRRARVPGGTYFFTLVTHERRRLFDDPEAIAMFNGAVAHVRERHPFHVVAYVILPDHLHTIWELPEDDDRYSTRWRLIKEAFTRAHTTRSPTLDRTSLQIARGEQTIWQRRFWEHVIRDERDLKAHLDYIHYNPVRHGLVNAARCWPNSSFASFVARGVYDTSWGSDDPQVVPDWMLRRNEIANKKP